MKAKISKLEYMVVQPHTYLVAQLEPGAWPVPFCVEMAERNRIPGLLPLHRQVVDGQVRLCYDITGKKKLVDLAAEMNLSEDGVLRLVRNLVDGLAGLPEFFLQTSHCLLEESCTYADSSLAVYLPLAPLADDPAQAEPLLRDYLIRLLGACSSAGRSGSRLNELVAFLIRPDFTLAGLQQRIRELTAGQAEPAPAPAAPVTQPRPAAPAAPPAPAWQPPAAPAPEPPADRKKGGFGGLFGRKEKEAAPVVDLNKERHMAGGDRQRIPPAGPQPAPAAPPEPAPAPQPAGGGWKGTTLLQQQEGGPAGTLYLGGQNGSRAAALTLICGGRAVAVDHFPFTVGRYGCDLLVEQPAVSKKHLTLLEQEGRFYVRDENSSNYTYLDGQVIPPYTPVPLPETCELRLGNVPLTVKAGV